MNMEAVKVGRNTSTQQTFAGVVSAGVVVAPANPKRVGIIFAYQIGPGAASVERVIVRPRRFNVDGDHGLTVTTQLGTLSVGIEQFGSAIEDEWLANDGGFGGFLTVYELTLEAKQSYDLKNL